MAYERDRSTAQHIHTLFNLGVNGHLSDAQLLERFTTRAGEEAELAFKILVERHGPMTLLTCRSILRNEHDAQDAFQATFLILARRAAALWVNHSLGPWLHRVACRVSIRSKLAVKRRKAVECKAAEAAVGRVVVEGRDDFAEVIHEEINRLPDHYRLPIVLCDLEGRTYVEAARNLDCAVGTVKSRLARGRERLRSRLSRRGVAPSVGLSGMAASTRTALPAIPSALADVTALAVTRYALGGVATYGLVSASVALLTESELKAMFLAKIKAACLPLLLIGAVFGGTALPARQAESTEPAHRDVNAVPPRLKFEIRVWRDGKESGERIAVDVMEEKLYRIETEDASIQIRPRIRQSSRPRTESEGKSQVWELNRQIAELRSKHGQLATEQLGPSKVVPDGIRGKILGVDPSGKRGTINLGSDDGLIEGQQLFVYRNSTHPQFVGMLVVGRTEHDWGIGELTASRPGINLRNDDIVADHR